MKEHETENREWSKEAISILNIEGFSPTSPGAHGKGGVVFASEGENVIVDDAVGETHFAVDKVVDPLPSKHIDLFLTCLGG